MKIEVPRLLCTKISMMQKELLITYQALMWQDGKNKI